MFDIAEEQAAAGDEECVANRISGSNRPRG
jgi:hypothetical protein